METPPLSELLKLSEADRIQLAHDLRDGIPEAPQALPLDQAQLEEVERRAAEHRVDPASALPSSAVRARLGERYGA